MFDNRQHLSFCRRPSTCLRPCSNVSELDYEPRYERAVQRALDQLDRDRSASDGTPNDRLHLCSFPVLFGSFICRHIHTDNKAKSSDNIGGGGSKPTRDKNAIARQLLGYKRKCTRGNSAIGKFCLFVVFLLGDVLVFRLTVCVEPERSECR